MYYNVVNDNVIFKLAGGYSMNSIYFSTVEETIIYLKKNSNKGCILFSSTDKINQLSNVVSENVVLCSTSGEYTFEGYKKDVITGFTFDISEAEIIEILYPPIKGLEKLKKSYDKVKNNSNAFMLLLCDGLSKMEEGIITSFYFMDDNFKIIGGSAGDYLKFTETFVYIGKKRVHSAAVFLNIKKRTQIIKENIYEPAGISLFVTEADAIKRTVLTFNNKPASAEYSRALGIKEAELPKYFMNNPLGKLHKDSIYISSLMKVNTDKSITFYSQIIPNTFVEILKPSNPLDVIKETFKASAFKPSFVFAVNCILRSLKFTEEGIWAKLDKEMLNFCKNTAGFISYGEQFYKHHLNQTMVLLLVE